MQVDHVVALSDAWQQGAQRPRALSGEPLPGGAAVAMPDPPVAGYAHCDAVRAAGVAPLRTGDPGRRPQFDGDGVGCGWLTGPADDRWCE